MRELEERSGVSRETIRYYIREGLLPEPARASRNSATYDDSHVARLRAIRRLQDERFLPLGVIKALLNAEDDHQRIDPLAFPALETEVLARLDGTAVSSWQSLADCAARMAVPLDELKQWVRAGVLDITPGPDGAPGLASRDQAIAERWFSLRQHGITPERGFSPDECRIYVEVIDWLADAEIRRFFGHMAGQVDHAEAVEAAEHGIRAINDVLGMMRVRALAKRLNEMREAGQQAAADPSTAIA